MAAILNPDILNLAMLDSAILVFHLKVTHTCQNWFSPFAQKKLHSFSLTQLDDGSQLKFCHVGFIHFAKKKNFNLSFSFNLMVAAILNSAILASAILHKKYFTHSFWHNLILAAILNSTLLNLAMVDSAILHKTLIQTNLIWFKLIHSHSNWWWQPSWILPCWIETLPSWIQTPCYLRSDSLKKHSHSTLTLTQTNSIWLKLIHSHLTWWWQLSWILPYWILPSWIQQSLYSFQSHSHLPWLVPTICTKSFTHSFWLNLVMTAILNSAMLDSDTAILDSDTLLSSLRFTQKHSHTTLTLTQTNSFWLKLIHCHLTWWWQPSSIPPSWFGHVGFSHLSISFQSHSHLPRLVPTICRKETSLIHSDSTWCWQPSWILPCWIQTPCYLLSDSLKNTLTPLWLWLKLIHSDSNSFILT